MSSSTTILRAKCHCGHADFTYEIPKDLFPLKSSVCHCNSCRSKAGHVFATFAVIPSTQRPDVSQLTAYESSSTLTAYFCSNCGATVCNFEDAEWEFATGILDKTEGLLERVQLWIEDTKDGGASLWLNDLPYERHIRDRNSDKVTDSMLDEYVSKGRKGTASGTMLGTSLNASCHCKSIQLSIKKATGGARYPAHFDACTSCRTVTGFEITSWFPVPLANIAVKSSGDNNSFRKSATLDSQLALSSIPHLKRYQTSEKVQRYFCGTCGATVFYFTDGNSDMIELGVGLLEAESGARAEEWLRWEKDQGNLACVEDAIDREFVDILVRGLESDTGRKAEVGKN